MSHKKSLNPKNRIIRWSRQKYQHTLIWNWMNNQQNLRKSVNALIKEFCIENGSNKDVIDVILKEAANYKKSVSSNSRVTNIHHYTNNNKHIKKMKKDKNSHSKKYKQKQKHDLDDISSLMAHNK